MSDVPRHCEADLPEPASVPFKGFVTTLRPPRPGGDCVGQKELLINKGLRVACWQVVVAPEGCEMRIHNCHPVATLKEITPCLSVSYSLYELPTTGLALGYLGISWPPFGRHRVGRMEEPATRWPPTEEPTFMEKTLEPQQGNSPLPTECSQASFEFGRHFRRPVVARFGLAAGLRPGVGRGGW